MEEETKILVAIGRLEEKYDKLDEDVKSIITKVDECMVRNDECTQKNFRYIMTTLVSSLTAIFFGALFLKGVL